MALRDLGLTESLEAVRAGWRQPRVVFAALLGLGLGLASMALSPLIVIGVFLVLFYNLLLFYRAEIGVLSIFVITSTIIFENFLPTVSFGFGSFHLSDLLLIALIGQVALRRLLQPGFHLWITRIDYFLVGFFAIALLSTALAIFQGRVSLDMAFRELRVFSYYLLYFPVVNLVRTRKQWMLLVQGMFFLSGVVAVAMIAQAVSPRATSFLPGYVATLVTQGTTYSDVIRIIPPGQSLVLLGFITSVVLIATAYSVGKVSKKDQADDGLAIRDDNALGVKQAPWISPHLLVALSALLGIGLALTFTRGYILSAMASIGLLFYVFRRQDRQRLIKIGLLALVALGLVLSLSALMPESRFSKITSAFIARVGTIGDQQILKSQQSTLRWRSVEYEYSLPQIASYPVIGSGIGSRYRPWDTRLDWRAVDDSGFDGRAYTHNAHVWILMKTGLLGYFCFVGVTITFIARGLRRWRQLKDPAFRSVVLGLTLAYIAVLIGSTTSPMLVEWFWVPILGSIFGLNEVAYLLDPLKPGREAQLSLTASVNTIEKRP